MEQIESLFEKRDCGESEQSIPVTDFISAYCRLRPFAFHLTAQSNLDSIRSERSLYSSKMILESAGQPQLVKLKRPASIPVRFKNASSSLRDQRPLYEGNIKFDGDMTFEAFIIQLNSKVFFWPGTEQGPIPYGERHFERYRNECPVILRVPSIDLFELNAIAAPLFCRFKSGSPRCSGGVRSPRGIDTFLPDSRFNYPPSRVVELVYEEMVKLPTSTEYSVGKLQDFTLFFGSI